MTALTVPGPRHYAVYTGRTTSWPMVAATGAGTLLIVLLGKQSTSDWTDLMFVVPLILVAVGVLGEALTGSSVRVTAGPNGLTIRWGLLGWPRHRARTSNRSALVASLVWMVVDTEANQLHRPQRTKPATLAPQPANRHDHRP